MTTTVLRSTRVLVPDGDATPKFRAAIIVVDERSGTFEKIICDQDAQDRFVKENPKLVIKDLGNKMILPGIVDVGFHSLSASGCELSAVQIEEHTITAARGGVTTLIEAPLNILPSQLALSSLFKRTNRIREAKLCINVGALVRVNPSSVIDHLFVKQLSQFGGLGIIVRPENCSVKLSKLEAAKVALCNGNAVMVVETSRVGRHIMPTSNVVTERSYCSDDDLNDAAISREISFTKPRNNTAAKNESLSKEELSRQEERFQIDLQELRRKHLNQALLSHFASRSWTCKNGKDLDSQVVSLGNFSLHSSPSTSTSVSAASQDGRRRPRSVRSAGSGSLSLSSRRNSSPANSAAERLQMMRQRRRSSGVSVSNWRLDRDEECSQQDDEADALPSGTYSTGWLGSPFSAQYPSSAKSLAAKLNPFPRQPSELPLPQKNLRRKSHSVDGVVASCFNLEDDDEDYQDLVAADDDVVVDYHDEEDMIARDTDYIVVSQNFDPPPPSKSLAPRPQPPARPSTTKAVQESTKMQSELRGQLATALSSSHFSGVSSAGSSSTNNSILERKGSLDLAARPSAFSRLSFSPNDPSNTAAAAAAVSNRARGGSFDKIKPYISHAPSSSTAATACPSSLMASYVRQGAENVNIQVSGTSVDSSFQKQHGPARASSGNAPVKVDQSLLRAEPNESGWTSLYSPLSTCRTHFVLGAATDREILELFSRLDRVFGDSKQFSTRKFAPIEDSLVTTYHVSKTCGIDFAHVVDTMTRVPADAVGLRNRGRIQAGCCADFVVLDAEEDHCKITQTYCAGQVVIWEGEHGDHVTCSNKHGVFIDPLHII